MSSLSCLLWTTNLDKVRTGTAQIRHQHLNTTASQTDQILDRDEKFTIHPRLRMTLHCKKGGKEG